MVLSVKDKELEQTVNSGMSGIVFQVSDQGNLSEEGINKSKEATAMITSILKQSNIPKLDSKYTFSFHIKPYYMVGDFKGDGYTDVAILIREVKSGKVGISIFNGKTNKIDIIGAGINNNDLSWIERWFISPKPNEIIKDDNGKVLKYFGDFIVVQRAESGPIVQYYWDGQKFCAISFD